jgi:hypothetical protein
VFFETLYRWLAWLFDWKSIKQAQICIATGFEQMLEFLQGAVARLRVIVDNGFANFKEQFADMMDEVIKLVGGYTIGGYAQRSAVYDADASAANSNNFFCNEFLANGASTAMPAMSFAASSPVSTLASLLTQLSAAEQANTDTFSAALSYFTNLGTRPDEIFSNLLAGMLTVLKGLGLVALDLANAIADALLDAVSDIIGAFSQMMTQKISVPFVSAFYKWVTGNDLTALNVVTLATAIPTAILYKIVTGDPMFTEDSGPGSSDDFTSWMKADLMLQAAGLAPGAATAPFPPTTQRLARGLSGAYLASTMMAAMIGGAMDCRPPTAPPDTYGSFVALGWAITSAVFSFPWFYADTGSLGIEGSIYMGLAYSLVVLAFLYTFFSQLPAPGAGDIMAIAITVAGLFLLKDAAYGTRNHPDARVAAWTILQRIPWCVKFLRTTFVVAATDEASLLALGWVDLAIGGVATGVLGLVILRERYDVTGTQHGITASPA